MLLPSLQSLIFLGRGLQRPECVLAHSSGLLLVPDWSEGGGVTLLAPDGTQVRHLARDRGGDPLRPNGIALEPGGSILMAHLGQETGGLYRLHPDGSSEAVLLEVAGQPLPPCNFVTRDKEARLWITVSTRVTPRAKDYRAIANSGFIVLQDLVGARIVADGLGYTNECLFDPDYRRLYVNETFARRLTLYDVQPDGALINRHCLKEFGEGTFPDGLALDEEGGLWIVSIVSNRVLRLTANGELQTVLEDCDPAHLRWVEEAFRADRMDRTHLDKIASRCLGNISSIAFGGPDRRTAFLGCLLGDSLASFQTEVRGVRPLHWDYPLGDLAALVPELKGRA